MMKKESHQLSNYRINEIKDFLQRLQINFCNIAYKGITNQKSLEILNEALTHTSATLLVNHERLEFLGDAVLRLAASEYIDRKFPHMNVGERSTLRAQLVSDRWLTLVGKKINIYEVVIIGTKASSDISARTTIEAETTEALIGALYECLKNLEPIHIWLTPHWDLESKRVLSDPHRQNYKSALQEWSQARGLRLPKYEIFENTKKHGDPNRFFCKVQLEGEKKGEGYGGSRREAEKEAAKNALDIINSM